MSSLLSGNSFSTAEEPVVAVDFEQHVAPILIRRCVECHRSATRSGGLDVTNHHSFHDGGDSGRIIDVKSPARSLLLQRIVDGEMPPEQQGKSQKLPPDEIEILRRWISAGATWPDDRQLDLFERTTDVRGGRDWWSFQPIVRPVVPQTADHPIDYFVQDKLHDAALSAAPPADRRTLLRRVHYDLTGLPPTPSEMEAFINDESDDAWEKVINKLLDSPHYGERWGRYWLDLVRYADTCGYERDQEKRNAWRYRDWVVQSLNADLPYNDFVTQQIAGDEMDGRSDKTLIATGFLRLGSWNDEPNDPKDYVYDRLEDMVHTTASTFLGLTVKCARCHTHKFDPIEQDDYYRFASAFWPGPIQPRDKALQGGPNLIELGNDSILGWTDVTAEPKPLHLLKNGERDQPMHEIVPASLSTLPALHREFDPPGDGAKTTRRRLQLADWITDPSNPLTSRVIVNRIWQHHFGQAIVRTPNNFGFLADPPTHPKLLDWLSAEFLENGGSFKDLHRIILTSRTWQQSSIHPDRAEYESVDAANRYLWHANRRRMDAESLRDAMLSATGELQLHVGGESFKPTIHAEALEGLSRKSVDWTASPDFQQKRRSLYVYMKRGLLPPMMTAFDLCDATQSCGKRDVTTSVTQALVMLNNDFVHSRADHLAGKVMSQTSDLDERAKLLWSKVLGREPTDDELTLAQLHLRTQKQSFDKQISDAAQQRENENEDLSPMLRLHFRADQTELGKQGKLVSVKDLSDSGFSIHQSDAESKPEFVGDGIGGQPALKFDGKNDMLHVDGKILKDRECTMVAVVTDELDDGHREILSNWNSNGNSTTSMFLGLTSTGRVRFTDVFPDSGTVKKPAKPFILVASSSSVQVMVHQNGGMLTSIGAPLTKRNLDTPWVIGTQGDHGKEFWKGMIAEVRVYDQFLRIKQRRNVEEELAERYGIDLKPAPIMDDFVPQGPDPERLALASLCVVLMNSNEFLYVD